MEEYARVQTYIACARVAAALVDVFLLVPVMAVMFFASGANEGLARGLPVILFTVLVVTTILILWYGRDACFGGRSLGRRFLGIRVVLEGTRNRPTRAALVGRQLRYTGLKKSLVPARLRNTLFAETDVVLAEGVELAVGWRRFTILVLVLSAMMIWAFAQSPH